MVQKAQWPIWESTRLIILGLGFNSHQSFGQWLKVLANLTNLANLFTCNLGKTPMSVFQAQNDSEIQLQKKIHLMLIFC